MRLTPFLQLFIWTILLFASAKPFHAQTVTITAPNGGEVLYACQTYTITWTTTGSVSNLWNIDYSFDGGTIWASVTSNFLSTNGQYTWTVPNVQSSTVLVRIRDAQNPTTIDQSNAYFSINIPITVLSPNGGEILYGNTSQTILWSLAGTSNTFNISYSVNGGSAWTNIVTNYSTTNGLYNWSIPALAPSTNCLIRVMDAVSNCMVDVSNAPFTLLPPTPNLLSPNGGESLAGDCTTAITWSTATIYTSTVRLEYTPDNGATWTLITNNATNNGSFNWTTPASAQSQVRVRIFNTGDLTLSDASANVFTILAPVTVTSPNGGETYITCTNLPITWSKSSCISQFATWTISLSTDNGATWTYIGTPTNTANTTTQSFNYSIPATIASNQCLVRVSYSSYVDQSNAVFSINGSNEVTVTAPNGGESWQGLTQQAITWTNTVNTSGFYELSYSINNGTSWTTIANNVVGNTYNWTVPNAVTSTALVRVRDAQNNCKSDNSNAVFSITPVQPVLLSPNNATPLQSDCSTAITWDITTIYTSTVRLEYSLDNGVTWTLITNTASNNGSFNWTVPTTPFTQGLIRIFNTGDLTLSDVSAVPFSNIPFVTVTSPNGGATYTACTTLNIAWTKSSCISQFATWNISLSTDNGVTWNTIGTPTNTANTTTQSFNYSIPAGTSSTQCKVRVSYSGQNDESDAVFTIVPNTEITVTAPNGGESWQGLTQQVITWTNAITTSGFYELSYSINNGTSWTTIANNVVGNTYNWTVPNAVTSTALVRVRDAQNNCKSDNSNAVFSITPVQPVLLSPNNATPLQSDCSTAITWDITTIYTSTVRLEYSLDNGVTWTLITNTASNNGSFNWTVPTTPFTQGLIRIFNTGDLTLSDVSAVPFSNIPFVTVTSPNGGATYTACTTLNIAWTKSSCISQFATWNISLSTDNGVTWNTIGTPTNTANTTTQSFNYSIPAGTSSTQCKVRVSYSGQNDESDAVFTIVPNTEITVTAPNGGESWQGLTQQVITWTNAITTSGFYELSYSINNGTSWTTIANNVVGNTYNWTVPNAVTSTALVRVRDAQNNCKSDNSNAVFSITPVQPVLLSPNNATPLQSDCSTAITWDINTIYTSTVRLEYSLDNGVTWTLITNTANNNGSFNWTVPTTPFTQGLVRIFNTGDLTLSDVSAVPFSNIPFVTVTSPNGGATYTACTTLNIAWTKSSCISQFATWNISLSTDNGATWNTIGTPTNTGNTTTQSFNYSIPAGTSSTQCKVRVSYSGQNDESDAVFTIVPNTEITVTAPNGGESWQGLTQQAITWTNTVNTSGFYELSYSINNGTSWTTIANNVVGNTYNWTVPNAVTSTALVRVRDAQNNCKSDNSNAVFSITPVQPVLLSPNNATPLQSDCSTAITWDITTIYTSTVRLEYSLDNGVTWTLITNTASNNGSFNWTVPTTPFTQGLIRIFNTGDLTLSDVSAVPFSNIPFVTVTSPNGGATYTACTTLNIAWTKSSCISQFATWNISLSTDNGVTWNTIGTPTNTANTTTQSFNYSIPAGTSSTQCKVRVSYSGQNDESDNVFTIVPNTDITLTSPLGGEVYNAFTTQSVTWTNTANTSGIYDIYFSAPGYGSTLVGNDIIGNAYTWTVPNSPTTSGTIEVRDASNSCKNDVSGALTVIATTPVLTSPNGGEQWYAGTSNTITWNSSTIYSNDVRLDYSIDEGQTWINIVTSTNNDGSHNWSVPNTPSLVALVRISIASNLNFYDVSNAVFEIKPAIRIITPNGDDGVTEWGGCTVTSITFERSPAYTSFTIQYSTNGGNTWINIVTNWSTTANPATYNWTMPNVNNLATLIRVSSGSINDQSDAPFVIQKPVTLIQPNFGGILQVGSNYEVQWSSDGISNIYDLYYSTNGGASYTAIVNGYVTSTNTYNWSVPSLPSTNCRMVIRDNINTCKADTSDVPFTISTTAAPITILTPNGNSNILQGCENYLIDWVETTPVSAYTIEYSINSGLSWIPIVSDYTTSNSQYNWVVPNMESTSVLLRVRSSSNPNIFDLSDAFFAIEAGTLEVSANTTTICEGQTVQLNVAGGSGYSWSPAASLNLSTIASPIASPSSTTVYTVSSTTLGCTMSASIEINVAPATSAASVVITSSNNGAEICTGTPVTFTAYGIDGGSAPTYQWYINDLPAGTNSSSLYLETVNDGDEIYVRMTSDLECVSNNPAYSNTIQMAASSLVTPTIAIVPSPNNSPCNGTTQNYTAQITNGGPNPSYTWYLNDEVVLGNQSAVSFLNMQDGDALRVVLTSNSACASEAVVSSAPYLVTLSSGPSSPSQIVGSNSFCVGDALTYTAATVSDATTYQWILPTGWTGSSTTTSIAVTAGNSTGAIQVSASNVCGTSAPASLNLAIGNTPEPPALINGTLTFCANSANTYSATPVLGATSYAWTLPSEWIGSSTSSTIEAVASSNGGSIGVAAINGCGVSAFTTLDVNPAEELSELAIAPIPSICEGEPLAVSAVYAGEVVSFAWDVPVGFLGTSTASTINLLAGDQSGAISVTAIGICNSITAIDQIDVLPYPAQPNLIEGPTGYCSGEQLSYTVVPVADATSYVWSLPNDWSGASSGPSIAVVSGNLQGNISVAAVNSCGVGPAQTLAVAPNVTIAAPSAINGSSTLCASASSNYSIAPVAGAINYIWQLPDGWQGNSSATSINAVAGINGGVVSVYAVGACGSSVATTLDVTLLESPDAPIVVEENVLFCPSENLVLSVEGISGLSYDWLLPADWEGTSDASQIAVVAGTQEGEALVTASNACGVSLPSSITLLANSSPEALSAIDGPTTLCSPGTYTFSVLSSPLASGYAWNAPSGWVIENNGNSADITINEGDGVITVSAYNACGESAVSSITVSNESLFDGIQQDGNTLLAQASGLDYQWIDCSTSQAIPGATSQSYSFTSSGTYAVTISSAACEITSDCISVVFVGIDESDDEIFALYPNPTLASLYVQVGTEHIGSSYVIYDLMGRVVERGLIYQTTTTIDAERLTSGIYVLEIAGMHRKEFVVAK